MRKKLILLFDEYPYRVGEYSFIRAELPLLVEQFEVTVISTSSSTEQEMETDDRIRLYHCMRKFGWKEKLEAGVKFLFSRLGMRELAEIVRRKERVSGRVYDSLSYFSCALQLYKFVRRNSILKPGEEYLVYSYWFNANCLGVLMGKERHPEWKVISRIHGYDLYEERNTNGRQPFRNQMDKLVDRLCFVADAGKDYYLSHWGQSEDDKYRVAPLGTINTSASIRVEQINNRKAFRIVSCSSVIPLKRVEMIVEALALIEDICVEWVHFGDGAFLPELKEKAHGLLDEKKNIQYELKGNVPVEEIMDHYEKNGADCFLMASSTEGCPVSVQEAMSYGIPIIATAVGEVPRMIQGNGVLLKANPTAEEIRDAVYWIKSRADAEIKSMREQSRKLWEEKYNALINSRNFVEELEKI